MRHSPHAASPAFVLTVFTVVTLGTAVPCGAHGQQKGHGLDRRILPGESGARGGGSWGRRGLAAAAAQAQPTRRACRTPDAPVAALAAVMQEVEERLYGASTSNMTARDLQGAVQASAFPNSGLTVPAHFHVIVHRGFPSLKDRKTRVTDRQIAAQIRVLNQDYAPTGLRFRLDTTSWHDYKPWARNCYVKSLQITEAVAIDPAGALNVVLCDLLEPEGTLGFAADLPSPGFDQNSRAQAVFIDYKTLPGGPYERFSGGRSLTHEVGHWAGLGHVFSRDCETDGDGIADTPIQTIVTQGCPDAPTDSCSGKPGRDSNFNFMDYADDSCMTGRFTPGQIARMQAVMLEYRPTLVSLSRKPEQRKPGKG